MASYEELSRLDMTYHDDVPRIPTREGVELYYESRGEGTAVTLLNTFFLPVPAWRVYTEELDQHYRVVSFDLCNHGHSSKVEEEPTWEEHAADLIALLDALEIESTYLIGLSTSTVFARDVALRYPDRVKGLVLTGPAFGPRGMRRQRQIQRAWLRTLESHGLEGLYEHLYPEVFSAEMNEAIGAPGFLGFRESFSALATVEEMTNGLKRAMQDKSSPEMLAGIQAPTLVVVGDDDFLLSPTGAKELAALFPDGACEIIPKAGHIPFIDDPEGFQAIVRKFVEEVESRA
ncbi:alpha/beta fold hydrolase [Streptomyces echinatus]|uniref:Pimeloyl-ACP methyl ester carboxylesterase n=1 Tax=Streptomyces echinatus TaxID=67293 RepID=A0A7W9PV40_9ACTN|nr:alpha/beta fold hydrolase [Streptomyces echinatus]MBB5928209.1 pimeloyl-ACP methyl ester carboxylesterase [Streptomyces echinatus]